MITAPVFGLFSHFSWLRLGCAAVTKNMNHLNVALKYQNVFTCSQQLEDHVEKSYTKKLTISNSKWYISLVVTLSGPKQIMWPSPTSRGSNYNCPLYPEGENRLSVRRENVSSNPHFCLLFLQLTRFFLDIETKYVLWGSVFFKNYIIIYFHIKIMTLVPIFPSCILQTEGSPFGCASHTHCKNYGNPIIIFWPVGQLHCFPLLYISFKSLPLPWPHETVPTLLQHHEHCQVIISTLCAWCPRDFFF